MSFSYPNALSGQVFYSIYRNIYSPLGNQTEIDVAINKKKKSVSFLTFLKGFDGFYRGTKCDLERRNHENLIVNLDKLLR